MLGEEHKLVRSCFLSGLLNCWSARERVGLVSWRIEESEERGEGGDGPEGEGEWTTRRGVERVG